MSLPTRVTVVEVGPRDGLQNERATLTVAGKTAFIDRLSAAGAPVIEVGAFVSPKWVPQMADTADVCAAIVRRPGTRYAAIVPNITGLERAAAAGIAEVAVFGAASETFNRRNINQSIDESFATFRAVCERAAAMRVRVRGYLSTCFGCPYEGPVAPARVAELTRAMLDLGVFEVAVSDTTGGAHPALVRQVLEAVGSLAQVALHFHDTRGTALANVLAGLEAGVTTFDASCGGLGGCPYSPGATGNVATEDLVDMLTGLGVATGIDLDALLAASDAIASHVDHPLPSRVYQAWRAGRLAQAGPHPATGPAGR